VIPPRHANETPEAPGPSGSTLSSPVTSEDDFNGGLRNHNLQGGFLASKHSNKLREILYPAANKLPSSIDMDLWLMKEGIYGPTKRLVKSIECLAKFINREGTNKPIGDFLATARSELGNYGWPTNESDEVNPSWVIYCFTSFMTTTRLSTPGGSFTGPLASITLPASTDRLMPWCRHFSQMQSAKQSLISRSRISEDVTSPSNRPS
jgi:hypothetical protein